jgi:hypothetical protein
MSSPPGESWSGRLRTAATLEEPADRLALGLALVVFTLVTPYVPLPGPLPAIRIEQILLLVAVIPVLRFLYRHPDFRRVAIIDLGFALLGIATALTILLAPILVPGVTRSFRDGFEVVRIAEYWLVYRIGLTISPPTRGSTRLARLLAGAAIVLGLFAVVQYLNPPGFNDVITSIWTQSHNLLGVINEGRAVGTAGNANQFGILATDLLFVALAVRLTDDAGRRRWLWVAAVAAATVSLVLAQSRGAIIGAGIGLVLATGLLLRRRTLQRALRVAAPAMSAAIPIVVLLIAIAPPASGSILSRFNAVALIRDPSVIVRVGRVQSIFTDSGAGLPQAGGDRGACIASLVPPPGPEPGHEPAPNGPEAAASAPVDGLATAVASFYCDNGRWPTNLSSDLVPTYLPSIPVGPGGRTYALYTSQRGFAVGLTGSAVDRDEAVGAGSVPNVLANASFEQTGSPPAQWSVTSGTVAVDSPAAAFGQNATDVTLPAGGAIYQLVVANLPRNVDFTFGVWVRPAESTATKLELYVVATTASGQRIDPLDARTLDVAAPGWQHLAISFRTPDKDLTFLQLMVRGPYGPSHIVMDGASLTEGPYALPFESLQDEPASSIAGNGPSFLESPIIGVGPQKNEVIAAYDDEYVLALTQYGLLGLASYVFLFATAFFTGLRAALRVAGWGGLWGLVLASYTVALGVFAISAGAYHQLQVMVIYWLSVGLVTAIRPEGPSDAPLAAAET